MSPDKEWNSVERDFESLCKSLNTQGLNFEQGAARLFHLSVKTEEEAEHVSVTFICRGLDEVELHYYTRKVGSVVLTVSKYFEAWRYDWCWS